MTARVRKQPIVSTLITSWLAAALWSCGAPSQEAPGGQSGSSSELGSGGTGGGTNEGGTGGGAAGSEAGVVSFSVPEGGGAVLVPTASGQSLELEFPASAAGLALELMATDAASIGWPEGQFSSVIDMQPHGTVFDEPVIVRPANASDLILHFSGDGAAVPEPLEVHDGSDGLRLDHFSSLAMLPGASCTEISPYNSDLPLLPCLSLTSTYAMFRCTTEDQCLELNVSCCTSELPVRCPMLSDMRRQVVTGYGQRGADGRCAGGDGEGNGAGGASGAGGSGAGGSAGSGNPGSGGSTGGSGGSGAGGASGAGGGGTAGGAGGGDTGAGGSPPAPPAPPT